MKATYIILPLSLEYNFYEEKGSCHVGVVQINIPWTVVYAVNSQRIFVEKINK